MSIEIDKHVVDFSVFRRIIQSNQLLIGYINYKHAYNTNDKQWLINQIQQLINDNKHLYFEDYVNLTMSELEEKRKTQEISIQTQKLNLSKAEANFKENMDKSIGKLFSINTDINDIDFLNCTFAVSAMLDNIITHSKWMHEQNKHTTGKV